MPAQWMLESTCTRALAVRGHGKVPLDGAVQVVRSKRPQSENGAHATDSEAEESGG